MPFVFVVLFVVVTTVAVVTVVVSVVAVEAVTVAVVVVWGRLVKDLMQADCNGRTSFELYCKHMLCLVFDQV
jgi:hypothetical protein